MILTNKHRQSIASYLLKYVEDAEELQSANLLLGYLEQELQQLYLSQIPMPEHKVLAKHGHTETDIFKVTYNNEKVNVFWNLKTFKKANNFKFKTKQFLISFDHHTGHIFNISDEVKSLIDDLDAAIQAYEAKCEANYDLILKVSQNAKKLEEICALYPDAAEVLVDDLKRNEAITEEEANEFLNITRGETNE